MDKQTQETMEKIATLRQRLKGNIRQKLLEHHRTNLVKVNPSEVRAVISVNPHHPKAKVFAKSFEELHDGMTVYVDSTDLQAILEDRAVVEIRDIEPPFENVRKTLGESLGNIPPGTFTDTPTEDEDGSV